MEDGVWVRLRWGVESTVGRVGVRRYCVCVWGVCGGRLWCVLVVCGSAAVTLQDKANLKMSLPGAAALTGGNALVTSLTCCCYGC